MKILQNRRKQQGAALLLFFLIVFAAFASIFLSSINTNAVETRRQQDIRAELEAARQGLLAYAVNYHHFGFDNDGDTLTDDEGPGRFPCPDVDNDGIADSTIAQCTDNVRGRLPANIAYGGGTYTLNDTFANLDQQFWYVLSPAFKEIALTGVNSTLAGSLSIDGIGDYVAVIIAPGDQLIGQDRPAAPTTASNYLEQGNVAGTAFINSFPANPDAFNDQVVGISFEELEKQIVVQAGKALGDKLEQHFNDLGVYPVNNVAIQVYLLVEGPLWFHAAPQENWLADLSYSNFFIPPIWNLSFYSFLSCPGIVFLLNNGGALQRFGDSC